MCRCRAALPLRAACCSLCPALTEGTDEDGPDSASSAGFALRFPRQGWMDERASRIAAPAAQNPLRDLKECASAYRVHEQPSDLDTRNARRLVPAGACVLWRPLNSPPNHRTIPAGTAPPRAALRGRSRPSFCPFASPSTCGSRIGNRLQDRTDSKTGTVGR